MKGIVLFGHGARSTGYTQTFERVRAAMLAQQPEALVETGFLELTEPDLHQAIARLAKRGAAEIVVVPLFIGAGQHVLKDLPALIAAALRDYPDSRITATPPAGEAQSVIDALAQFALGA